ncbi:CBS domain-containing protein [Streptomyces tricolor]
MLHRLVGDLMTSAVVSVRQDTGFKDIAEHLAEHHTAAVPVVDGQGRPVGVLSEADLLRKQESQADPGGRPAAARLLPAERAKADALTAEGLTNGPAVMARPRWPVVEAARAMARHHVKRPPVVDDAGRLVGIVSRSDLPRVFLRRDLTISEEIRTGILTPALGLDPGTVTVQVTEGRGTPSGTVPQESLTPVAIRLSESVDGVIDVTNRLRLETGTTAGTTQR